MLETKPGPDIITGQQPAVPGGQFGPGDYNADAGPSAAAFGYALVDPRYRVSGGGQNPQPGAGPTVIEAGLFGGPLWALDQAPSTAATANIAALANPTSGTPLTLVGASGAGITLLTASYTVLATGNVIPSGSLAIDGNPGLVSFGQSGAVAIADPTKALARAVSVTGVASGTGGTVTIKGANLDGFPQTETITLGAGAVTANGKKGFKWIFSATPNFTDTHTISIGTADIFEFPFAVLGFAQANCYWNNVAWLFAQFTPADTTSPATPTTGSTRGTIAPVSASDGTKKLQMLVQITPANLNNAAGLATGLFGVKPA